MGVEAVKQTLVEDTKPDLVIATEFTSSYRIETSRIPNSALQFAHQIGNDKIPAFSMNSSNPDLVGKVAEAFAGNGYKKVLAINLSERGTEFTFVDGNTQSFTFNYHMTSETQKKFVLGQLEIRGIKPSDLELLIYSFVNADTGSSIAKALGGSEGLSINVACSGFPYGIAIADALIKSKWFRDIVVVSTEKLQDVINFGDYSTCALFADGAGAARFVASDDPTKDVRTFIGSSYSAGDITLGLKGEDKICINDGQSVAKNAIRAMQFSTLKCLLGREIPGDESSDLRRQHTGRLQNEFQKISLIVAHDANARMRDSMPKFYEPLGVTRDKFYSRMGTDGNCSCASAAKNLDYARREGRIKNGEAVFVTTTGGGYTFGAAKIVF